ncbi:MAG: M24 family metallopeptidase [Gemmatimonadales bacterium]
MTAHRWARTSALILGLATLIAAPGSGQEARRRWERLCQIRQEKFDRVLPEVMRENGIDMWIVAQKEGHNDPMYELLGRGYTGSIGYYLFTDRGGGRIERVALGITGGMLEQCPSYDRVDGAADLKAFVAERTPKRIGINTSDEIGTADGLTHTLYLHLGRTLGEPYRSRLVSAEKLISDYRSRHVASEIVAFGEAGELSRTIAERALSNEVVIPGRTTLADVAWWMWDQLLARGLGSSFDMPSVYVTGPTGIEATSNERIIQRGDLLVIDWGVGYLNFWTDVKRIAYVLREGERSVPPGFQRAFDQAAKVRETIRRTITPGGTAKDMLDRLNRTIAAMPGFAIMPGFNQPSADPAMTDVIVGCHSVGDQGHGSGPSIAWFNPVRLTFQIRPTNLFSIEFFAYTAAPEFGGKKVRIPLEDDAIVTERGIEWLYPINPGILLIK